LTKDEGSLDEEIIQRLIEVRVYLDERIKSLEDEVDKLKSLFKIVDEVIVSKSFRTTETVTQPKPETAKKASPPTVKIATPQIEAAVPPGEEIPLKAQNGRLLANVYTTEEEMHILPAKELALTVNTPPFQSFLINRILESMRLRDQEDAASGAIPPSEVFEYHVVAEGESIIEIAIRNYGNPKRLREIITTARWTLEKMNEKEASSSG
jgi:hypothetical protein